MQSSDGNEIRGTKDKVIVVPCTRWKELQGSIEYHAELAGLIQATTIFRLLNDPGPNVGPQEFSIGDINSNNACSSSNKTMEQDVATAIRIVQHTKPQGVTRVGGHSIMYGR
jgi:hypothetical protein